MFLKVSNGSQPGHISQKRWSTRTTILCVTAKL
jgi:hypothetical protein